MSTSDSLPPEAIIGVVALFLALHPLAFGFWRWRRSVRRLARGADSLYASDGAFLPVSYQLSGGSLQCSIYFFLCKRLSNICPMSEIFVICQDIRR